MIIFLKVTKQILVKKYYAYKEKGHYINKLMGNIGGVAVISKYFPNNPPSQQYSMISSRKLYSITAVMNDKHK